MKNDIVEITCYGKAKNYKRKEAIKEFNTAVLVCEGSERERYAYILSQLLIGETKINDEYWR